MKKNKTSEHLEVYNGHNKFSFVNATIWQCIKFWAMTKFTGGVKPNEENSS